MSEVPKMSMFGEKKKEKAQQQDIPVSSDKFECCVVPGNDDDSPKLKLDEYDGLVLFSYKDVFLKAFRDIPGDSRRWLERDSNHSISEIFRSWGAIGAYDLEHIEEFNDVLILGILCKVLCRVGLPSIQVITKHSNLFEQFIKETLEYYLYHDNNPYGGNYTFSVDRALKLVSKERKPDDSYGDSYASYILLGTVKNIEAVGLAELRVNKYCISLTRHILDHHFLVVPLSIATSFLENVLLDYLYDSLIWILLAKEGFCVDNRGSFYLLEEDTNDRILDHSTFYEHVVFNPLSVDSFFQKRI